MIPVISVHDFFPTRVWLSDCADLAPHHPDWLKEIAEWREAEPQPQGRSNRLGWNSPITLFERPSFGALRDRVGQAFLKAFQDMQLERPLRFRMEAWVNLHERHAFNVAHAHPHALMSACYYLQAPEGSGSLIFRDPRPAAAITCLPGRGMTSRAEHAVAPREGLLVVFPHWLEHSTGPHGADTPRVAVAINARPVEGAPGSS